jgi:diguanylate cyclase (GGDEF)-like protein/PAS domain S-box-containing protein
MPSGRHQQLTAAPQELREQHVWLDTALNNISQGLAVFDKDLRLVLCNQRYVEMFDVPSDMVASHATLPDLVRHHFARGFFKGDPEKYIVGLLREIAEGKEWSNKILETADGRIFAMTNRALAGGGRVSMQEDVTQRRKDEEQIRQQRMQLDTALNNMSQGLIMFDKDLKLAVANRRYAEMYRLPPDFAERPWTLRELVERHFETGVLIGDTDEYMRSISQSMVSNEPVTRIIKAGDGRVISIINRHLEGGGRIATHEDITERYRLQEAHAQAETKLHEQRLHLDSALNNMSQGLCMFDASARIVLCNRRFIEMHRLSPDVAKPGCTLVDLIRHRKQVGLLDVDPEQFARQILESVAKGETRIVHSTEGRTIRVVNQPMPAGGWVTTHEDITERQQTEDQLREQKLQLDTALDNMSQGLVMFDAQTRLIVWNQRYLQMYGLPANSIRRGMKLVEILELRRALGNFSRDPQTYVDEMRRTLAGGQRFDLITELADGRTITVSNQPMPGGGWVSSHEDITERRQAEQQLNERKLQLDTALNNMTQGLNMFDASGRMVVCNQRYREMYGLAPEASPVGSTVRDLVQARIAAGTFFTSVDPDRYADELLAAMNRREPTNAAMELTDGRVISVSSQPTPDGSGWVVTHEDVTERRRAEQERDRSQAFASTIIESVPATIVVKDVRDMRYVLINRAGEKYFGLPREKMIGKTTAEIFSNEVSEMIAKNDEEILKEGQPQFFDEHPTTTPTGQKRIVATTRLLIRDSQSQPQYLLSVVEDRTHRKRVEAQIAHMAHHDTLTGLPNRSAFGEGLDSTIDAAKKDGTSFALMTMDLDRFKEINDVFGQGVGDALLREVGRRLQETIGGALLTRLGGDEFAVIATDGDQPAAAEALADRMMAAMGGDFEVEGRQLRIGLSLGIAIFPVDGGDATTLVANADAALYRAKSEGRGTYRFFEAGMDERLRERRVLQQELQSAIERGELTMHYQPQAKIGGEVTGFEALVRWRNPARGIIPPGTFIPLAEESGLIIPMGEWILREACKQAASWSKPLHIAINLSPVQFHHGDLPALVHTVLLETGLSPSRLELEITEGVLIGDFARAVAILRRLKALGVRIAMDDFGSGYSSLSYLHSFPFDKIKIDQTFISNLETNPQSATIIRAVIGLARALEVPVVAEGVETPEQLAFLESERCDEVQGYLIGRPRPIDEYAEMTGQPKKKSQVGAAAS